MPEKRFAFGDAYPEASTWETWREHAESEQAVMVSEFHHWIVKTKAATEQRLLTADNQRRAKAPIARAGMEKAATPREVPMCVLQFTLLALEVLELERKIKLLNVYYRQAANEESDTELIIEEGNEAEVNELWNWFIECRNEKK